VKAIKQISFELKVSASSKKKYSMKKDMNARVLGKENKQKNM